MSRIGNLPIPIAKGVDITQKDDVLTVKGPNGTLTQPIDPGFSIEVADGQVTVKAPGEEAIFRRRIRREVVEKPYFAVSKPNRARHGLYRSLIANMIKGVSEGFEVNMELVGVGYKVEVKGQTVELAIGYSHAVHFVLPAEVKGTSETVKGANPKLTLKSHDKQLLGQVAAKIRRQRPPEPYKGKGIRFVGEQVRRKAGKSAGGKKK